MKNVVRCQILKMAQKHGNSAAAHAREVLPISVTNELVHRPWKSAQLSMCQIWWKSVKNCAR